MLIHFFFFKLEKILKFLKQNELMDIFVEIEKILKKFLEYLKTQCQYS